MRKVVGFSCDVGCREVIKSVGKGHRDKPMKWYMQKSKYWKVKKKKKESALFSFN